MAWAPSRRRSSLLGWCAWLWLRRGLRRHALAGCLGALAVTFGAGGFTAFALGIDRPRPCDEVRADPGDFRDARRDALSDDPPTDAQLIADP
jgi:hypothetical protein